VDDLKQDWQLYVKLVEGQLIPASDRNESRGLRPDPQGSGGTGDRPDQDESAGAQGCGDRGGVDGWISEVGGIPVEWAICTHAVLTGAPYRIVDSEADPQHAGNPILRMAGLPSYLGVPLIVDEQAVGAH
jgi:GAF domain-containing protein